MKPDLELERKAKRTMMLRTSLFGLALWTTFLSVWMLVFTFLVSHYDLIFSSMVCSVYLIGIFFLVFYYYNVSVRPAISEYQLIHTVNQLIRLRDSETLKKIFSEK